MSMRLQLNISPAQVGNVQPEFEFSAAAEAAAVARAKAPAKTGAPLHLPKKGELGRDDPQGDVGRSSVHRHGHWYHNVMVKP